MRLIAFVTDRRSITRILASSASPSRHGTSQAGRGPPWDKDFEPRQGTDLSEPPPEFEFDQRVS
jgi:hypothetical protein